MLYSVYQEDKTSCKHGGESTSEVEEDKISSDTEEAYKKMECDSDKDSQKDDDIEVQSDSEESRSEEMASDWNHSFECSRKPWSKEQGSTQLNKLLLNLIHKLCEEDNTDVELDDIFSRQFLLRARLY